MNNLQSLVLEAPDEFISGLLSIVFIQHFELEEEELSVFAEDAGVWYLIAAPSGCHLTGTGTGHIEGSMLAAFHGAGNITMVADKPGPVYAAAFSGKAADEIFAETLAGLRDGLFRDKQDNRPSGPIPGKSDHPADVNKTEILYFPGFALNLQTLFTDLAVQEKNGGRVSCREASAKAYELLMSIYRMASLEEHTSRKLPLAVSTALLMIHEEYAYLEGIAEVAERVEVSQEYLTRSFKKYLGVTPARYLTRIRLERAKQMLQKGDYSISLIAETCGFAGSNYFIKVFTESVGMTPGKYKKEFSGRGLLGNPEEEDYYVL